MYDRIFLTGFYLNLLLVNVSSTILASSDAISFLANHKEAAHSLEPAPVVMKALVEKYLTKNAQYIQILDLSDNAWNSDDFISFTKEVENANLQFDKLSYLVLRENRLDHHSAEALLFWLKLKQLRYINVASNPLSLKHIDLLFQELEKMQVSRKKNLLYMGKILFMEPSYVKIASSGKVGVYAHLVQVGHLPPSWARVHQEFYASKLYKDYKIESKKRSFSNTLRSILSKPNLHEEFTNDGELLSLTEGLSSLSLNEEEGSGSDGDNVDVGNDDDGDDQDSD